MKNNETTDRIDRLECAFKKEQQNNNKEQKGNIIKIGTVL